MQGHRGQKGQTGQHGAQGDTGVKGPTGPPGPNGAKGPKGAYGREGNRGEKGAVGTAVSTELRTKGCPSSQSAWFPYCSQWQGHLKGGGDSFTIGALFNNLAVSFLIPRVHLESTVLKVQRATEEPMASQVTVVPLDKQEELEDLDPKDPRDKEEQL